jgi:putative flippase GtrA
MPRDLSARFAPLSLQSLRPVAGQAFRYGLIGCVSMLGDLGLYALLTRVFGFYFLMANATSFVVIGGLNYLANRFFTFGHRGSPRLRQFLKFLIIVTVGVGLNTLALGLLVTFLGLHDLLAKIVAAGFVFFWNFGMNRAWTFRETGETIPLTPL